MVHLNVLPENASNPAKRSSDDQREKREESPDQRERGMIAPRRVDERRNRRSSGAIPLVGRAPLVDRATRRTIASISPPPRDLIFSSAARSQFDHIWWIFLLGFVSSVNECGIDSLSACLQLRKCMENWACKAFSVKMFEWTKHWN